MAITGVQNKIRTLRKTLRQLALLSGLARLLLIGLGLAAFCLVLDWTFHLESDWRLMLGLGCLAAVLCAVWRYLVLPATVAMPDDQIALLFERRFPELADRMVSAVQLAEDPGPASDALVRAVLGDANTAAEGIDPRRVPRARKIHRMALGAVASAGLALTLCLAAPQSAGIFAARFLHPYGPVEWPRDTQLTLTVAGSDRSEVSVPKGEQVAVVVRARNARGRSLWTPPKTVWVDYQFASGRRESRQMRRAEGNTYQAYFKDVPEAMKLTARAGKVRSKSVSVQVVELPRVDTVWLSLTYPSYTGQAAEPPNASLTEVRAFEGTRVKVEIQASRPLKPDSTRIVIDPTGSVLMRPREPKDTPGATHAGEFTLAKGMRRFQIRFTDEAGLSNRSPRTYEIYVIEDRPPQVKLVKPGSNTRCTRYAIVPLEINLRDDLALRSAWIHFATGPKEAPQTAPLTLAEPRAREATINHAWDMSELGVQEGQTLSYRIEADDFRDVFPEASEVQRQVGRSDEYYIQIVSSAELAGELDRQLFALREEVRRNKLRQEQDRRRIEELLRKIAEGQPLTNDDRSAAADSENVQRELGRSIERVAEGVGQIRDRMRDNRIGSFADRRRLEDIATTLKDIAATNVPRAAEFIKNARRDLAAREGRDNLQNAAAVQQNIIQRLDRVLAGMSHNEDIDNLVRAVRELLQRQQTLKDDTAAFSRPEVLGAPLNDLNPTDRAALNLLVRGQNAARDDMRNLEQDMLNVYERLQKTEPKRAELVRQAQVQASRDQVRPMMETAAGRLAENNTAQAAGNQQKAIEGLERLLEMLQNARQESGSDQVLAQVIDDVKQALEDVNQLYERQKGHAGDAAEVNKNAKQAEALKQLRRELNRIRSEQDKANAGTQGGAPAASEEQQAKLGAQAGELADKLGQEAQDAQARRAPQASDIQQAGQAVEQARKAMAEAAKQRGAGNPEQAGKSGGEASDKLAEADRKLAEALEKIEKKRRADARETALKQGETEREARRVGEKLDRLAKENENTSKEASDGLGQAGKQVGEAGESMKGAQSSLDKNDTVQGEQQTGKARDELAEAKRKLEKLRDKLEEKQKEQKLLDLIAELQPMLDAQLKINDETRRIDDATAEAKLDEPVREHRIRLGHLATDESKLATKADELARKVEGENAPVFAWGLARLKKDMNEVKERLLAFQTDSYTQDVQRDIADTLRMLIDALKREQSRLREDEGGGEGGGGGGGGGKPMLVPPSAQLKLLKARELEIHNDTKRLDLRRQLRPDGKLNALQTRRVERLAGEQAELSTLTLELAEALEREVEENLRQQQQEP